MHLIIAIAAMVKEIVRIHQESISLRTIIATPNKIHITPLIKFKRIMDIESIQARTGNMHNIKCLVTRGNRKRYMKII
jgi:hypothetical protein